MDEGTKDRIRDLLSRGVKRSQIARQIGVSPSTVTRWARLLGFPDVAPRPSQTDWRAVQSFYDLGHSITECKHRFGFTYGAWDKAVTRGDLTPRGRNSGDLGRSTRDAVENLVSRGLAQADIARELGIAKSTVAFHMRALGHRADPRFARRLDWQAIQAAIDGEGLNMAHCSQGNLD